MPQIAQGEDSETARVETFDDFAPLCRRRRRSRLVEVAKDTDVEVVGIQRERADVSDGENFRHFIPEGTRLGVGATARRWT